MTNLGRVAPNADVFGVCPPGYLGESLEESTPSLEAAGVSRLVWLLSETEARSRGLSGPDADGFEAAQTPIRDRYLPGEGTLAAALAAVRKATTAGRHVALHCNAGLGRAGLAAALVRERAYGPAAAVETVEEAERAHRRGRPLRE